MTPQEALDLLAADAEEWDRYEAPTWWERFKAWLHGE